MSDVTTLTAAVSISRLLLVADDDCVRKTVREALPAEGYEVLTCVDGASALNLNKTDTPDPVDLMLQIFGRLDLCRELRRINNPAGGACLDHLPPRELLG